MKLVIPKLHELVDGLSLNKFNMLDKKNVLVNFILDKSGSMQGIKDATISGVNEYINNLKRDETINYSFSLTLFDENVIKVHINAPLSSVTDLTADEYKPDGMTALYDAVCQTINNVRDVNYDKILTVIMTDGQENSSHEYTQANLKEKIDKLNKTEKWTFVFLGANQDAWLTAKAFGIGQMNTANFNVSAAGAKVVYSTLSANTAAYARSSTQNTNDFMSAADQDKLKNA